MKALLKWGALALSATLLAACASQPQTTKILLVHSSKVDCDAGAGATTCYKIKAEMPEDTQAEAETANDDWQLYYSDIKGFDFEPGYQYKIKVTETVSTAESNPAQNAQDVSLQHYTLVEVLEKTMQTGSALNDIWVLQEINGENVDTLLNNTSMQAPNLEINLAHGRVYGSDSCNRYSGSIKVIDEEQIELSQLVSTRKLCPDMSVASKYLQVLTKAENYTVNNGVLTLTDSQNQISLTFKKVD